MTPSRFAPLMLAPLLGLAACSLGIQVGQVSAGGSTGASVGCAGICLLNQTGDPLTTASFPDPCEVDLDFGNVPIGLITSATIGVENTGSSPLDLSKVMPNLDPELSLKLGSPELIQPGATGQLTVTFQPYKVGAVMSTFTIPINGVNSQCQAAADASGSVVTVELIGNGTSLSLVVQPDSLDFGTVLINTTLKKSVTLINKSTAPLTGITATISGTDAKLFAVDDCPATLEAGDSAVVDISYSPLALETRSMAVVTFSSPQGEIATLNLFGEPVGVALTIAPLPIDFGYVPLTTTAVACTTVSNQANLPVVINGTSELANGAFAPATMDDAVPPNPYSFPSPSNPLTLSGGESAKVCLQFTPPISEQYNGTVTLTTNDPSGVNPTIVLTGWGGGPQISCTPTSLDFGAISVGSTSTVAVLCTNSGSAILPTTNLILGPPTVSPDVFTAQFDTIRNPYPDGGLAKDGTAQIDVTYAPTISGSNDKGSLFIENNGGKGVTVEILLTGQGAD